MNKTGNSIRVLRRFRTLALLAVSQIFAHAHFLHARLTQICEVILPELIRRCAKDFIRTSWLLWEFLYKAWVNQKSTHSQMPTTSRWLADLPNLRRWLSQSEASFHVWPPPPSFANLRLLKCESANPRLSTLNILTIFIYVIFVIKFEFGGILI